MDGEKASRAVEAASNPELSRKVMQCILSVDI